MSERNPGRSMGPAESSGAKQRFEDLSSRAFEHPADRAALTALRKIPAFDAVLRKLLGLVGERSLRYLYLGGAVRVGPRQFPRLHAIYQECVRTLDLEDHPPELFVSQTPFVNAGAIGVDRPFVVVNSATLALLDEEESAFILGHELGHILSDHVLYKTMLALLLRVGVGAFGVPLGGLALMALVAALSEWHRKSEISCDRAGLLCTQNKDTSLRALMKLAGGANAAQMSVDEFIVQAAEYDAGGGVLDSVVKLMNLIGREHPLNVLRVAELKQWAEGDEYRRIVSGDYPRRGDDAKTSAYDEFKESAKTYQKQYSESKDPLLTLLRDLGNEIKKSFDGE